MAQTNTAEKIPQKQVKLTPMMRQYVDIKDQYPDAILMYRLGDFYEMFFDDAKEASQILDLTLTTRNKNSENPVPLCGVPHHAVEGYIAKLVAAQRKVVICDQVEDPKQAKGIVKREVTRVVSPGTVIEEQSLSAKTSNYIMCVLVERKHENTKTREHDSYCYALCDVSTGQLEYATVESLEKLGDEITRLGVKEFIFVANQEGVFGPVLERYPNLYHRSVSDLYSDDEYAKDIIIEQYPINALSSLGLEEDSLYVNVLGIMLAYLKENKLLTAGLLQQPLKRENDQYMVFDEATVRNMELFKTLRDDTYQGTLLWHLDTCVTSMGSRLLAEFIRKPLLDPSQINARLESVEECVVKSDFFESARDELIEVADLERLANRFVLGSANARDALALKQSFWQLPKIYDLLKECESSLLKNLTSGIGQFELLAKEINHTLVDEPPLSVRDGRLIRQGVSEELDELRDIEKNGKGYIAKLEIKEKEKTGIPSLKVRFNNVFGYYIEITNTHKDKVPEGYIRKQTLTNAERYITEELKEYEHKVLGASERIKAIEYDIFCSLRDKVKEEAQKVKETAKVIALLDVILSFAKVAKEFCYVKPSITNTPVLELSEARHPILERMNIGERYIPNDLYLDATNNSEMIITGPNMAGKSTVMRMAGLLVIMAQIGSFVPCEKAAIGVCDRVFTRVGAHDHLQKGLSTFMVEMVETARILREATSKSLILLDEIGRGTSTFDGLSIAWAVAEDLHDRLHARTLFATHYHELCDLAEQKKGIKNYQMTVREWNQEIIFLRKLKPGGSNRSYGVAVAGMAGLPLQTVKRAKEILKLLELKDLSFQSDLERDSTGQMGLFEQADSGIAKRIKNLDLDSLTPLDALNFLHEIKKEVL